jgi:RNA polymerase sigma factor (sigma-70 family)
VSASHSSLDDQSPAPVLYGPWANSSDQPIDSLDHGTLCFLFEDQRQQLFRFLYRLTNNASDADDLLQETFLMVWRKRDQFAGRGSAAGYLRTIAFRVFLNARQRSERRAGLLAISDREPGVQPAADAELEQKEIIEFLFERANDAIANLSEEMREAFLLFRFEQLTCVEIAEAIEIPVKTVESRVRRATLILAEKLKAYKDHLPAPH